MDAHDPQETQQQENLAKRTAEGTNQRNREESPQEKCGFRCQLSKRITLNDVIMVTDELQELTGYWNILARN